MCLWLVLGVTTLVSLYPLYGMYVTALTPTFDTVKTPPDLIPIHASLDNFQRLVQKAKDYPRWFANSLVITLSVTAFHVFFDTLAGYAFAKKRFPGRDILFAVLLATLMIPPQVTLVPLYVVIRSLGLLNNVLAVILPGTARVLGIFLMRQYIRTLPTEIEEAARSTAQARSASSGTSSCRCVSQPWLRWQFSPLSSSGTTSSGH